MTERTRSAEIREVAGVRSQNHFEGFDLSQCEMWSHFGALPEEKDGHDSHFYLNVVGTNYVYLLIHNKS